MSTSKVIITIVVIALVGLGAGLAVRMVKGKNSGGSANITTVTNDELDISGSSKSFAWGVTLLTFPFPTYRPEFTTVQMTEADKLGLNYIRVDYAPSNPAATDLAVDESIKNGIKVVLVIPFGPKDIFTNKNLEADTRTYVGDIVKRYKGKVAVYQLATEVASVALRNNASLHGIDIKDYPADSLNAVTTWVKVGAETVKATDPSAKRLVNDQWVHTAFFDNYFAKGGELDILGWNWFSDMGTTMDTVTLDAKKNQTYALMEKLKGYNKPIWLTEVSRRLGSQGGNEKAQAEYLTTMANYAKSQSHIKGFFVYNLLEDQVAPEKERGYSLITAADQNNAQKVTGHKAAYDTYQKIIKESR